MKYKVVFAGTPEIAANLLTDLINAGLTIIACYTQPDRPKGRQQKLEFSPVKNIAIRHNIPVFQPATLKSPDVINTFRQLKPDLMIVFAYGLMLPTEILIIPKFGCFNVHTSLLPKWRGAAPVQHAILAGDLVTGISIIKMDPGLDQGDVFYKIECPITASDTSEDLYHKLQPLAREAILAVLQQLNANQITPTKQNHTLATYASKINKLDAKIDWSLPAIQIDRIIRAFIPTPVAFTEIFALHDPQISEQARQSGNTIITIRIWQASLIDLNDHLSEPGSIINVDKQGICVATGCGIVRLEKLQFPGGKILNIVDLLNSPKYKNFFRQYAKFN